MDEKKSCHTLCRQSFDMTISHMAVSQSEAMISFKLIIKCFIELFATDKNDNLSCEIIYGNFTFM